MTRLSLKRLIASSICADEGFAPDESGVFAEDEPAYFSYLRHAEKIIAHIEANFPLSYSGGA